MKRDVKMAERQREGNFLKVIHYQNRGVFDHGQG